MKLYEILTENIDDEHFEASAEFAVAEYIAKQHEAIPTSELGELRDEFRHANEKFGEEYDNNEDDDEGFYNALDDMQELAKGLTSAVKQKVGADVYDKEQQAVYNNDNLFDEVLEKLLA